jgi:hypothetical protein
MALAIDVMELSWEVRRYRILRHNLSEAYRQKAIEELLRRIDIVGLASEFEEQAAFYTSQNAVSWRTDPIAAGEIETRLASYGLDQHAISMETYAQAREVLVLFEAY